MLEVFVGNVVGVVSPFHAHADVDISALFGQSPMAGKAFKSVNDLFEQYAKAV